MHSKGLHLFNSNEYKHNDTKLSLNQKLVPISADFQGFLSVDSGGGSVLGYINRGSMSSFGVGLAYKISLQGSSFVNEVKLSWQRLEHFNSVFPRKDQINYWGYDSGLTLGITRIVIKKFRGKSHLLRTRFHWKISRLKIPSSFMQNSRVEAFKMDERDCGTTESVEPNSCLYDENDLLVSIFLKNKKSIRSASIGNSKSLWKGKSQGTISKLGVNSLKTVLCHSCNKNRSTLGSRTILMWLINSGVISPGEIIQYQSKEDNVVKEV